MNKILVIIVTYNGIQWLERCLSSLRASECPVDVFVTDNCSTDGTRELIRTEYPDVILYESEKNEGFGRANNIGLEYALERGYEYVYLLNQDAWVFPDTLGNLTEAMRLNPQYGILSPVQMTASMERPDLRFEVKCLEMPLGEYEPGKIYDVDFVMAAHWMISLKCLETVGGFSPAFGHYGEDDNYIHRAFYHGFKVGFLAGTCAVHDRELRPQTRKSRMKLKCVASVVKVSNPLNCLAWRLMVQPFELLAISVMRLSADVLRFIPSFLRDYPRLISLRRASKGTGAFLSGGNE